MQENLVALSLFRRYGIRDAVYHYNHGVEVNFVIPEVDTAIQVCYTMNDAEGTFEREISALVRLLQHIKTKKNVIVTFEDENMIEKDGIEIEVIPAWKFVLKN